MLASVLGWLGRLIFRRLASPEAADEVALSARDFMETLRDDSPPVPLPSRDVARQHAQAAQAAHAFPPSCPPSLPPSAPPAARLSSVPPAPPSSVPSHRVPPAPQRSQSRPSSGPPPRLPPVHLVPVSPPPAKPPPVSPRPPRPSRKS